MLRVSATSRPGAVAGAIAKSLRINGEVELQSIGPAANNRSLKGLIIARRYLRDDNLDLNVQPAFVVLEANGEERTAIRFKIRVTPLEACAALNGV